MNFDLLTLENILILSPLVVICLGVISTITYFVLYTLFGNKTVDSEHVLITIFNDLINTCKIDKKTKKICKENNKIENKIRDYLLPEKDIEQLKQKEKDELLIENSKKGNLEVVKYLIESGADIHVDNDANLRWASNNGHLEVVKFLIENGADIHEYEDRPLILASIRGHLEVVKYLVQSGADIHVDNDECLSCASQFGHLEVVKYLVESGADIHAKNDAALTTASGKGHLEIVEFLKSKM